MGILSRSILFTLFVSSTMSWGAHASVECEGRSVGLYQSSLLKNGHCIQIIEDRLSPYLRLLKESGEEIKLENPFRLMGKNRMSACVNLGDRFLVFYSMHYREVVFAKGTPGEKTFRMEKDESVKLGVLYSQTGEFLDGYKVSGPYDNLPSVDTFPVDKASGEYVEAKHVFEYPNETQSKSRLRFRTFEEVSWSADFMGGHFSSLPIIDTANGILRFVGGIAKNEEGEGALIYSPGSPNEQVVARPKTNRACFVVSLRRDTGILTDLRAIEGACYRGKLSDQYFTVTNGKSVTVYDPALEVRFEHEFLSAVTYTAYWNDAVYFELEDESRWRLSFKDFSLESLREE